MSTPNAESKKRPTWLRWLALFVFFIPMFPITIYRTIKLVAAQDSDDPEDLVQEIQKVNQLSKVFRGKHPAMRLSDRAKIAKQRVLQNRLEEAQGEFSNLREELKDKNSEREKYLLYYCNYWLANIRGDMEQTEYELRQAAKLSYSSSSLGLPEPKGQDDFDLGFDQELLRAAEDAGMTVENFVRDQTIKR